MELFTIGEQDETNKNETTEHFQGNMQESRCLKVLFVLWLDNFKKKEDSFYELDHDLQYSTLSDTWPSPVSIAWSCYVCTGKLDTRSTFIYSHHQRTPKFSWRFYSSPAVPHSSQVINLLMGLEQHSVRSHSPSMVSYKPGERIIGKQISRLTGKCICMYWEKYTELFRNMGITELQHW